MEKKNVVIKVDNEREYRALMKYYDSKGWKWYDRVDASNGKYKYSEPEGWSRIYVQFKDIFLSSETLPEDEIVIPFTHLAAIEGIELGPEEIVIEMKNEFTCKVYPDRAEVWSTRGTGCTLYKSEIEEIYTALKSFEK